MNADDKPTTEDDIDRLVKYFGSRINMSKPLCINNYMGIQR
jgi:hypothetical protein